MHIISKKYIVTSQKWNQWKSTYKAYEEPPQKKNLDSSYLILRAFVESSSSYAIVVAEALYHRKYWAPASNSRIYIEVKAQTVHSEQNLFQKR